jgi:excisionase family DNA binding protein
VLVSRKSLVHGIDTHRIGIVAWSLRVSRNRRDEQQTLLYGSTVLYQQKDQLLKAEEIAERLGLKVQTVYAMARRGELEKVKLSRRCLRFRAGDVERLIERKAAHDMLLVMFAGFRVGGSCDNVTDEKYALIFSTVLMSQPDSPL